MSTDVKIITSWSKVRTNVNTIDEVRQALERLQAQLVELTGTDGAGLNQTVVINDNDGVTKHTMVFTYGLLTSYVSGPI